jgi:hypothetical protein
MSQGEERRHYPRAETSIEVRTRPLAADELPLLAGVGRPDPPVPKVERGPSPGFVRLATLNLSLGGISAEGELELESAASYYGSGAIVVVEFDLPDGAVRAVAQVTRSGASGGRFRLGLRFLLITDSAFMRLQDHVLRRPPRR